MKLKEYYFTEYYHQYITIEADVLTDLLKDNIKVTEKDCYALCSSYIASDGLLEFNVLAIGSSWEHCTKGLRYKRMLGTFTMEDVYDLEARIALPTYEMIKKNTPFIEEMDKDVDDDLLRIREDSRLDPVRDIIYPDDVLVGVIIGNQIFEFDMEIKGINGPFLTGILNEEPEMDIGLHIDDPMWALPYVIQGDCRLFALFAGDHLSEDEKRTRDEIIRYTESFGLNFHGISLKN